RQPRAHRRGWLQPVQRRRQPDRRSDRLPADPGGPDWTMRRVAVIAVALVAAVAWWVTTSAGADDSHTYRIEMYNAFGIVNGSDVRVAGVNAGSVTGLDVDAKKRALLTVSLSGPLPPLGKDTRCASAPQSP